MSAPKQQTAVQWLVEKLMKGDFVNNPDELIERAKAMFQEQIMDAFWNGDNSDCLLEQNTKEFAEQYYKETYETI
jgi:hypothetical protein